MTSRERKELDLLPLYVGGELDDRERAEVEQAIASDPEVAAEARRYEQAFDDLQVVRETRPDFEVDDDVWEGVRAQLFETPPMADLGDRGTRRSPRIRRVFWMRFGSVAALLMVSFLFGFSMRDFGWWQTQPEATTPGAEPLAEHRESIPASALDSDLFRVDGDVRLQEIDPGFRRSAPLEIHRVSSDGYDF